MKSMKKKRLIFIAVVAVCVSVIGIAGAKTVFQDKKKDPSAYQYREEEPITEEDIAGLEEDGQTIELNGYIVTLEKYCYNAEDNSGRCLISIMKEGKKGKDIMCVRYWDDIAFGVRRWSEVPFWEDLEFWTTRALEYYFDYEYSLEPGESRGGVGTKDVKMSVTEDKLYVCFQFIGDSKQQKDMIVIREIDDRPLMKEHKDLGIEPFRLTDNTRWRRFTDGQNTVSVCDEYVEINDGEEKNIEEFEVYMKDGTKHIIQKGDMREAVSETKRTCLVFDKRIHTEDISYIKWKGKKLEEVEEQEG